MDNSVYTHSDELMDVLLNIRQDRRGNVDATFIDGAGQKATVRLSAQAARDLRDELNDMEDNEL
jgi:hypothetical protein